MLKEIEQLLILQDRDRKLRTLRQELKNAPIERKHLEEKLATAAKQFEGSKLKGKEIEVERKRLENEAQSKRDQIAKYQTQKFQTRKNEEFQALSNEITRFEGEVRQIEDRELELMEAAEELKPQIADAEKAAQAAKSLVERQLADLEAKGQTLQAQIKELEAERAGLASAVDEDLLDTYQRLFATKGEAVVALEHEVCTGCHMKVTASTSARVKARRELVHCEQCGRILYGVR
ncbi:zinc ribbon domain-containing protein [Verrucomicrobiota bacterium sgz303538]